MPLPSVKCGCPVNVAAGQPAQYNNKINTQRHMVIVSCANACNILWGLLLDLQSVQPSSGFWHKRWCYFNMYILYSPATCLEHQIGARARAHTHTHTYTHICTPVCVCVCIYIYCSWGSSLS